MAIDQTNKALNMASETINAAQKFMEAIETLRALEDERAAAGLTLTDFDADYAAEDSGIKHINGTALNLVLASTGTIWTFMVGANHDDNFQAVRP